MAHSKPGTSTGKTISQPHKRGTRPNQGSVSTTHLQSIKTVNSTSFSLIKTLNLISFSQIKTVYPTSFTSLPLFNKNNNNDSYSDCSVVNLSNHTLTQAQTSLFSKGLNFCPTPFETNLGTIRQDFDKFHRSLQRHCVFNTVDTLLPSSPDTLDSDTDSTDCILSDYTPIKHNSFKNPSEWNPTGPLSLEAFIISNEADLSKVLPARPKYFNLSYEERKSITELKAMSEITIKSADKGSAVALHEILALSVSVKVLKYKGPTLH